MTFCKDCRENQSTVTASSIPLRRPITSDILQSIKNFWEASIQSRSQLESSSSDSAESLNSLDTISIQLFGEALHQTANPSTKCNQDTALGMPSPGEENSTDSTVTLANGLSSQKSIEKHSVKTVPDQKPLPPYFPNLKPLQIWHGMQSRHLVWTNLANASPDYRVGEILGSGGMGRVHLAQQLPIDREVAVKVIRDDKSDASSRDYFFSEAVITGELDHPNIVPIYEFGLDQQRKPFYSMKRIRGTPWRQVMATNSLNDNLNILLRVCDAIAFAHTRGVVHCDLKPANVMIGEFGEVFVVDWGLAQLTEKFRKRSLITDSYTVGGTPSYMAPELAACELSKVGPPTDIYLLGGLLFTIITGKPPHEGKTVQQCLLAAAANEIVPVSQSGELLDIAYKAMATLPHERFDRVQTFQAAIKSCLEHFESIKVSMIADNDLETAKDSSLYEDYTKAIFGYEEALKLWEGNERAQKGLGQARIAQAHAAKSKGDLDFALSLIDPILGANDPFRTEVVKAREEHRLRQQRLQRAKRFGQVLIVMLVLVVGMSFLWINNERAAALISEQNALESQNETEQLRKSEAAQKKKALALAEAESKLRKASQDAEKDARLAKDEAQKQARKAKLSADAERLAKLEAETQAMNAKAAEEKERLARIESQMQAENARRAAEKAQLAEVEAQKQAQKAEDAAKEARLAEGDAQQQAQKAEDAAKEARLAQEAERLAKEHLGAEAYVSKIGLVAAKIEQNAFEIALRMLHEPDQTKRSWEWGYLYQLCSQSSLEFTSDFPLNCFAISPDQKQLAVGGLGGAKVVILNADSFKEITTISQAGERVSAVEFSHDGKTLAVATSGQAGSLTLWKVSEWTKIISIEPFTDKSTNKASLTTVAFAYDNERILAGFDNGNIRLWDTRNGKFLNEYQEHFSAIRQVTFRPSFEQNFAPGELAFISVGDNGEAIYWEGKPLKAKHLLKRHSGAIFTAQFSTDGTKLATAGSDGRIVISKNRSSNSGNAELWAERVNLLGHDKGARTIRFSKDGATLISGGDDGTIRVWDLVNSKTQSVLRGHSLEVLDCEFHSNGYTIFSCSSDRSLRKWNVKDYQEVRRFESDTAGVLSAQLSPDGRKLITSGHNGTCKVWDTQSGKQLFDCQEGHTFLAKSAVFSPDGEKLFTAAFDSTRVWEVNSGGELANWNGGTPNGLIAISTNGKFIATGSTSSQIIIRDAVSGKSVSQIPSQQVAITALAFSPDNKLLLAGDIDGNLNLWNINNGTLHKRLRGHTQRITDVDFITEGNRAVTASTDKTVAQWDIQSGKELTELVLKHPDAVRSLALSPNGRYLITCCRDGVTRLWDLNRAQVIETIGEFQNALDVAFSPKADYTLAICEEDRRLKSVELEQHGGEIQIGPSTPLSQFDHITAVDFDPRGRVLLISGRSATLYSQKLTSLIQTFGPQQEITSAGFSPDGRSIVSVAGHSIHHWNAENGNHIKRWDTIHSLKINSLAFSPIHNTRVLTASDDGCIRITDLRTGEVTQTLKHSNPVLSATYSRDGRWVVSISRNGALRLWDLDSAKEISFVRIENKPLCVCISPDSRKIAVGNSDSSILVYEITPTGLFANSNPVRLEGHTRRINSVVFTHDGLRILSGSADSTCKIWDIQLCKELLTLSRHVDEVTYLSFSFDGKTVVSSSLDGTVIQWLAKDINDSSVTIAR